MKETDLNPVYVLVKPPSLQVLVSNNFIIDIHAYIIIIFLQ